jgi:hypothetical protein
MNIRVFLSQVAGSNEKDIEYIERAIAKNQPFGLGCQRSKIVFLPATFKAYWLWSDNSPGPTFVSTGVKEFVDTVKMQYLTHKTLITTEELLKLTKALDNERTIQQVADFPRTALPQPGEPA